MLCRYMLKIRRDIETNARTRFLFCCIKIPDINTGIFASSYADGEIL